MTLEEAKQLVSLRSQSATLKRGRGSHRKYLPHVFTEHGAVMLASVLNSPVAVAASIHVVRAFVRLRQMVLAHKKLAAKLLELERKIQEHDGSICKLFRAVEELVVPPAPKRRRIGFRPVP